MKETYLLETWIGEQCHDLQYNFNLSYLYKILHQQLAEEIKVSFENNDLK